MKTKPIVVPGNDVVVVAYRGAELGAVHEEEADTGDAWAA